MALYGIRIIKFFFGVSESSHTVHGLRHFSVFLTSILLARAERGCLSSAILAFTEITGFSFSTLQELS